MRASSGLITLIVAALGVAMVPANRGRTAHKRNVRAAVSPQCTHESLRLKQGETDAAMGGVRATDFIFTNSSSSVCTIDGYPRVELLNRKGLTARRATPSNQLPTDSEKMPPQLVSLAPGKTAWFRIYYNAGGAGHIGKPCPTYPKIKVLPPGMTSAFVLHSDIQSCFQTDFQVSAVRSGAPE